MPNCLEFLWAFRGVPLEFTHDEGNSCEHHAVLLIESSRKAVTKLSTDDGDLRSVDLLDNLNSFVKGSKKTVEGVLVYEGVSKENCRRQAVYHCQTQEAYLTVLGSELRMALEG